MAKNGQKTCLGFSSFGKSYQLVRGQSDFFGHFSWAS